MRELTSIYKNNSKVWQIKVADKKVVTNKGFVPVVGSCLRYDFVFSKLLFLYVLIDIPLSLTHGNANVT